ncbi:hypothetical protein F8388_003851 [Cannabis sativa]|uniref:Uncharacterized protein n=1 Tax=Cannabis sativa TaxID=3483 RepID=A0A7J6GNP2_CANSA|nr:hypothetical protein F8388_003851 [Cannabis sativa]KAF4401006.1 hypothetical protein G4B88_013847 [Cannabis sativa]
MSCPEATFLITFEINNIWMYRYRKNMKVKERINEKKKLFL